MSINTSTIIWLQTNSYHPYSLDSGKATPPPINYFIHIIPFVKLQTKAKKLEQYFAILGKPSRGSGTRNYITNCATRGVQILFLISFLVIYLSIDNVLLLMVIHQTGSIFWLVSHKDRFLALFYFLFTSVI